MPEPVTSSTLIKPLAALIAGGTAVAVASDVVGHVSPGGMPPWWLPVIEFVKQVGFPAGVAAYVLYRIEPRLDALSNVLHEIHGRLGALTNKED